MKKHWVHEAAKFCAGLVAADFLTGIWASQQPGILPISFMGITITQEMILPWLVVDIFLFIMLVHYAWHIGKIPRMKERMYLIVAGSVFTVIALAHLTRIFTQTDIVIADWTVPTMLSWLGVAVTTYLAYASFHLATRMR